MPMKVRYSLVVRILSMLESEIILTSQKKRFIAYLLAGVITAAFNVASFNLFLLLSVDYRIANLFAMLLTKLLAFVVHKKFTFKSKTKNIKNLSKEFAGFFIGRILTGLLDYFGLIVLVEIFSLPQKGSKYGLQVIVIILNYIFARLVFTNTPTTKR